MSSFGNNSAFHVLSLGDRREAQDNAQPNVFRQGFAGGRGQRCSPLTCSHRVVREPDSTGLGSHRGLVDPNVEAFVEVRYRVSSETRILAQRLMAWYTRIRESGMMWRVETTRTDQAKKGAFGSRRSCRGLSGEMAERGQHTSPPGQQLGMLAAPYKKWWPRGSGAGSVSGRNVPRLIKTVKPWHDASSGRLEVEPDHSQVSLEWLYEIGTWMDAWQVARTSQTDS
ncbi:hypothetical protein QBC37DRAFT_405020 [Rhypophila decipiens]|uniref:Uncharacterized protein n=1 Tax=Rhypophila decipiens TaxID=261697 RepID=A0AAN6XXF2_9PEZI|nr:hypothetical protein QBC37DRAFT_405020 [Rhypophila decipiens]